MAKRKQAVTNRKIQITSRFYFRLAAAFVFVILFLGFVSIILSIEFQKSLIEFRKLELKRLVTLAYNSVESHLAEYAKGHIGRDEAASRVRTTVRQFIYNDPSGENYIFVHSYDGTMLVQPFEPFKEGTNQWNLQDANGVYIIRELVAAARKGSGFVEYRYPPPGSTVPQRKISYVVGIPLLDCYIGTGM
ncbi:MAG TPA: cache domain-containing protein, partial [Spirochaetia bacterium]|nr:cache domain-containing protein [Spirochaetia bacterium]